MLLRLLLAAGRLQQPEAGAAPQRLAAICDWRCMGAASGGVLRLAPAAAHRVIGGMWSSLHSVVVTGRLSRHRLLNSSEPSKRKLALFMASEGRASSSSTAVVRQDRRFIPHWANLVHKAAQVVVWVRATRHLRDLRRTPECSADFAKLFAGAAGIPAEQLTSKLRMVSIELLRRSMARLDFVSMVLWRKVWAKMVAETLGDTHIYLFTDASPQWKGLEFFASSYDVFSGGAFARRLFPMVSLDKSFMDAIGKTLAFLWQAWLLAGPGMESLMVLCSRVRAITTDQGVERFIVDFPGRLDEFFALVDPDYVCPAVAHEFLFPRALAMPGWLHMWDLVIRRGLCGARFFPEWVRGLKAIVGTLRRSTDLEAIGKYFRRKGAKGAADPLKSAKLPSFAEWRWGTLERCCAQLSGFIDTLRANFDPKALTEGRDSTTLT